MEKKWENIGIIIYLLFVMLYHAIRFILVSKGLEYRAAVQICSNIVMWGIPPIYAAFKIKKVIVLVILAIPALFAGFLVLWFVFGNIATEQKLDAGLLEVSIPNFPKATITEYYEAVYFLARRKLESGPERDIRLLRYKYNIDFTQAEDEKGKYISGTYPQVQVIVTEEGNDDYIEKVSSFYFEKAYNENNFEASYTFADGIFRLILEGYKDIEELSKTIPVLIGEAMTDPLFQNFSGVLKCEFKYGDQGDIRSYYFHTQDSLSEASENYTNPEFVKTELEKNYNSLKERIRIQTEIEDEKETMESVTEEYPPLEKNKLNAFEILFENILSEEFEDYTYGFNAKGNFYAILEDGETEFGEHGIVQYDIRIVFDRVDDNGNHLFVQNICYYQEDGNARSELSTGIMERYAVNLEEKTAE